MRWPAITAWTTILLFVLSAAPPTGNAAAAETGIELRMLWWSKQRRGANCQNQSVEPAYWQAAAEAGIEFVRLAPDGWAAQRRDFLIGDADRFETLLSEDLAALRRALDDADAAGVKVVLTLFSLPGARWSQLDDSRDDYRLWNDQAFRDQALSLWTQLAGELKGHPAIVAYNPLNEPHPEREHGISQAGYARWHAEVEGTLADVNRFNGEVVQAIRAADPRTPILLDGGQYASTEGLRWLQPVDDTAVLYAFHVYEPWDYVTFRVNEGRYRYPDRMPDGWTVGSRREALAGVAAWAGQHRIDRRRIIASEFGCDRRVEGAAAYLDDLLTDLESFDWHWAFYAFRGDGSWGGLDYELGTAPFSAEYWTAVEGGADPEELKQRGPNPLWQVLAERLSPEELCVGDALVLRELQERDHCSLPPSQVRDFPGPEVLAAEIHPLTGASKGEVEFPVVYRNLTDRPLRVDLYLMSGPPLISPTRILRDGEPVEPPSSCKVLGFGMAQGRSVTLLPGGTLSVDARFFVRPGGWSLSPTLAPGCDLGLPPGEYVLQVPAPQRDVKRVDSVVLTVTP